MEYNLRGNFKLANESEWLVCELNRSRLSSIFLTWDGCRSYRRVCPCVAFVGDSFYCGGTAFRQRMATSSAADYSETLAAKSPEPE